MRREVEPWLRTLKSTAAEPAAKVFKGDGFAFAIQYDPKQSGFAGCHLSYDIAASLTENPLFRALSVKADQLRAAPEDAIRLVIACDGDYNVLRSKRRHATAYSATDVARDFLRQRRSVDLVLLVTVRDASFNALAAHRQLLSECELVGRPETQSLRLTQAQAEVILKALSDAIGTLPTPVQHPYNAVERLKRGGFGPDRIGGYERGGNRVKLSSRAVQRLLAGEISTEAFAEAHWDPKHPNPFLLAMQRGQVIKSVRLEDRGPKDDDWLEFTFGYDVAQAPFVASAAPIAVADADANSDDSET